jgi:hypothetical protein
MNWKNVAFLISVERKSGRLIRGQKLTRFRESKFFVEWYYWLALGLGVTVGVLASLGYNALRGDPSIGPLVQQGALSLFFSLPTLALIYSIIFTMLGQIQRSGIKATSQVPYWLPITWQEHTLGSILANMLGFPFASVLFIAPAIIIFSFFVGLVVPALLTSIALLGAIFMASSTTEIFRILQVRFIGAVYKSTGRAAVWVRFAGSMLFFIVIYIIYFYVIYGSGALTFIQTVASAQSAAWFVPFVWLGLTLYSLTSGLWLQGFAFLGLSLLFLSGLFLLATWLNTRFGLYEPPAITVTRGIYAPKTGFLGRLGFSTVEAALIRKDLKAFTRRRELMTIFIAPIVIVVLPIMQTLGQTNGQGLGEASLFLAGVTFLFPASLMAMTLGNLVVGEEGQAVWRIYAAPISARSLVKSKYYFIIIFGLLIFLITGVLSALLYQLSLRAIIVESFETVFLVFALSAVSLSNGIKGADFNEVPRPRMIRVEWTFINLAACFLAGLAILSPLLPYVLSTLLSSFIPGIGAIDPYVAVIISGVVAIVITLVFYRLCLRNAQELLSKAEV